MSSRCKLKTCLIFGDLFVGFVFNFFPAEFTESAGQNVEKDNTDNNNLSLRVQKTDCGVDSC